MHVIIQSTINTLNKSRTLLQKLTNEELQDVSISPYFSSVGSHIRHILDFYDCIFNRMDGKVVLTSRKRNLKVESCCTTACAYLDEIINKVQKIDNTDFKKSVVVIDDLGLGSVEITYYYEALFAQANSHAIHHYAIIHYILDRLKISINDASFGYNPTTPKPEIIK